MQDGKANCTQPTIDQKGEYSPWWFKGRTTLGNLYSQLVRKSFSSEINQGITPTAYLINHMEKIFTWEKSIAKVVRLPVASTVIPPVMSSTLSLFEHNASGTNVFCCIFR